MWAGDFSYAMKSICYSCVVQLLLLSHANRIVHTDNSKHNSCMLAMMASDYISFLTCGLQVPLINIIEYSTYLKCMHKQDAPL